MRLWPLLPIIAALHNTADATPARAQRFPRSGVSTTILTPDFVDAVQQIVDTEKIPGLTLAVVYTGGSSELGAWGIKSELGTKMTTDTLFNIGSCSKAFLSASLGILIDDFAHGRNTTPLPAGLSSLSWKTKVAHILPDDWELMDPWASQKANLIDILSHMSGLGRHDPSYKPNYSVGDVTRNLRNLRPTFELREQWLYNNQMYMVGAHIVSTLSGMRFADFVNNRIFKPLDMSSSTYSIDAAISTGRFTSTWTSFGRLIPHWLQEEFVDLMAGPAGVITSVEDLVPWVRMFLNGGADSDTNSTITPQTEFDVITSPHSITSPDTSGQPGVSTEVYGLGWFRFSAIGRDIIMHDGAAPGVSAVITAALEDGIGIIALANADAQQPALLNITFTAAKKAFGFGATAYSPPANTSSPPRDAKLRRSAGVSVQDDRAVMSSDLDLAGAYCNAGYGTVVLCGVHSPSSSCQSVLDDFRSVDESLSPNSTDLFTSWNTPWSMHARFTDTGGSQFVISIGTIYADGYGKDSTPFSTLAPLGLATFVVENKSVVGFGISGMSSIERAGPVEETSEVWFVKKT